MFHKKKSPHLGDLFEEVVENYEINQRPGTKILVNSQIAWLTQLRCLIKLMFVLFCQVTIIFWKILYL